MEETLNITSEPTSAKDLSDYVGLRLNEEELNKVDKNTLLNFVESNINGNELTEDERKKVIEDMQQAVQLPEVIDRKEELSEQLGLTANDLKALYSYLSGKGDKPLFLDRYLADNENKLKDFQQVMILLRLSAIPQLAAMQASIQERLYSPENLINLDTKDLTQASANLSREMSDIMNSSIKSVELINSMGRVDSKYRSLMDKLLVVPDEVLYQIEHLLSNY